MGAGEAGRSRRSLVRVLWCAVLAVLGASAFIYSSYQRDIRAARARIASGSTVVNTACGPIQYAEVGHGLPLLIIHGAGGGFDQGLDAFGGLSGQGFRVIAPSRFGYLRTPLPQDASPAAQADAHACLLDALGVRTAAVIGASAGGPSTIQFCLRHAERCSAMVLLVPLAYAPRASEPRRPPAVVARILDASLKSDFVFWAMMKLGRDTMIQTILATPMADFKRAPAEEQKAVLQMLEHILPISPREQGLRNDGAIATSLPRVDLEHVRVPTLAISVENDGYGTFAGARYTADHIPGARFVGYKNGGHLLVGHQRELTNELVEFLRSHCARAGGN